MKKSTVIYILMLLVFKSNLCQGQFKANEVLLGLVFGHNYNLETGTLSQFGNGVFTNQYIEPIGVPGGGVSGNQNIHFIYVDSLNMVQSPLIGSFPSGNFSTTYPFINDIVQFDADGQGNSQLFYSGRFFEYNEISGTYTYDQGASFTKSDEEYDTLSTAFYCYTPISGDLDNDGDDDIFTEIGTEDGLEGYGELNWFENLGNGESWQIHSDISFIATNFDRRLNRILDVNGDNLNDVVLIKRPSTIMAALNNGSQNFTNSQILKSSNNGLIEKVFFKDLNGDQNLDIVTLEFDGFDMYLIISINDGNYNFPLDIIIDTLDKSPSIFIDFDLADFNLDGIQDIVFTSRFKSKIYLGNSNLEWELFYELDNRLEAPISIFDINRDGYPDILGNGNTLNPEIEWIENEIPDSATTVSGTIYQDINENGQYNENIDIPIPNTQLTLQPSGLNVTTDENGNYSFDVIETGDYTLILESTLVFNCDFTDLVPSTFTNPSTGEFIFTFEKYLEITQDFGLVEVQDHCRTIAGKVFNDLNGNGIHDNIENGLSGILVNANEQSTFTDFQGNYSFEFSDSQSVNIKIDSFNHTSQYCSNETYLINQTFPLNPNSYTTSSDTSSTNLDFGLKTDTIQQGLEVGLYSLNVFNGNGAGEAFHAFMDFKSQGNPNETCTLRIEHDPLLTLLQSSITTSNIGANFVEWIFPPGTTPSWYCMQMDWFLDSTAIEGDTLHWEASYECPPTVDLCPYNNLLVRDIVIQSGPVLRQEDIAQQLYSMRPEGIMPYELGLRDSIFSYVINFQNSLTDTVYNVILIDTLPEEVIANSISRPFSSHEYEFRLIQPNIAIWEFKNINLPSVEDDEINSYGFVQFNVLRLVNLAVGTTITNQADILFNNSIWETTNEVLHIIPDFYAPTALCNETLNVYLDESGQVSISTQLIDAGSSDNVSIESLEINQTDFDCSNLGNFTVELIAIDEALNSDACTTVLSILDTIKPEITCVDIGLVINAGETESIQSQVDAFVSSDNCAVSSIQISQIDFTDLNQGDNEVTITVEDESGNETTCQINVNIEVITNVLEGFYGIELTLAPNPMSDYSILSFSKALPFEFDVILLNVKGQMVRTYSNLNKQEVRIDKKLLPSGIYLLQLRQNSNQNLIISYKLLVK